MSSERLGTPADASSRPRGSFPQVSIVIPCLDEASSIGHCVTSARLALDRAGVRGEVIVADNDSSDDSARLAREAGGRVVQASPRGYGSACRAGLDAAQGEYVVIADGDGTYDFAAVPDLISALEAGADVVIGNRMDGIEKGAMPWLHRYVGNPVLSRLLNQLFRTNVRDAHCGMRAFRRSALDVMDLRATGMEFASEMIVQAARARMRVDQVPVTYSRRTGTSKLSTFRDGWRHLRLLLLYAPLHLFVLPGASMVFLGVLAMLAVFAQIEVFGREWYLHTAVAASTLTIAGAQLLSLGLCAHTYSVYYLGETSRTFAWLRSRLRLEHGLLVGGIFLVSGVALFAFVAISWADRGFERLSQERLVVVASTLMIIGVQTVFTSFLLSFLGLHPPHGPPARR